VLSEQATYRGIVTKISAETLDEKSARHFRSRRGYSGPDDRGCAPMSREKPGDDPRQRTDEKSTKQSNEPWKAPVEKEQKPGGPPPDLEKWHDTNTH
jgi:hypothetical protein